MSGGGVRLTPNAEQTNKWIDNAFSFFIPLLVFYLGQVTGTLQDPKNTLDLMDFAPNSVTLGGMLYYIMSCLIDYRKKLQAS